jgi:predicted ArsR family transcriptional regulator
MKSGLILGAGRGPRLAVLEQIKRSAGGLCVKDLAATLGMSYMGVKAHCLALTSAGFLETWRNPSSNSTGSLRGRPKLLYRLTGSGNRLFSESGPDLALDLLKESVGLFGSAAPQKLLTMYFRSLGTRYREMLSGKSGNERIAALVALRDQEGRMSTLSGDVGESRWEILESHNPLASLMSDYPEVRAMEEHLIGEILGLGVSRTQEVGGVVFRPRV